MFKWLNFDWLNLKSLLDLLEPFSWEREFTKKKFSKEASSHSWDLIHEVDVPRTLVGRSPKDLMLFNLCVRFHYLVRSDEFDLAKETYDQINERVEYLNKK
jgi:hypothetical protein